MTAVEILEEAQRLIRERGWRRDGLARSVLTHLTAAAGARFGHIQSTQIPALHDAIVALRKHLNVKHLSLWETVPARTQEDVLAALEEAKKHVPNTRRDS